jgi:hypothetical protein
MALPGAILFTNDNIPDQVRDTLRKQLAITTLMDGATFDGYVELYPTWPTYVKNKLERVMVMRSFRELDNRTLADVVIYVNNGMAAIETNKFGPPGLTYRVAELYWGKLMVYEPPLV